MTKSHCRKVGARNQEGPSPVRENVLLRTRVSNRIACDSAFGEAPTRQLHATPIGVSGSGHAGYYISSLKLDIVYTQVRASQVSLLIGCSSPFMRLLEHITALGAWCKQCLPAGSVKARHAPSRHGGDARVYGYTTTRSSVIISYTIDLVRNQMEQTDYTIPPKKQPACFSSERFTAVRREEGRYIKQCVSM